MNKIKIYPLQKPIDVTIEIPGSLSYTIRALNIAAMVKGAIKISNPVKSDDSYAMVNILKKLGIKIEEGENYFIVHGNISDIKENEYILDVGISGRTARSILALLTIVPGIKTLTCQEGFKKRPVKDLVDGLRQLGAKIEYLEQEGFLPVKIYSEKLHPGMIEINGNMSSQYASAIMMIAPLIGEIIIEIIGEQASKPFIDVTIDAMKTFAVEVINENYKRYTIKKGQQYKNIHLYTIEADAIAASYFWGIAALTKSRIKVLHLSPESEQGDVQFADILDQIGCNVEKNFDEKWISVQGTDTLKGIDIHMNNIPDSVPSLAVVSAFVKGSTNITGLEHLKIKESNRIESPKKELRKMGIEVHSTHNSLNIAAGKLKTAEIDTHGDQRIAMAFAIAGTKLADGIIIKNPEVVNKSFPDFWKKLQEIGVKIEYL